MIVYEKKNTIYIYFSIFKLPLGEPIVLATYYLDYTPPYYSLDIH